MTCIPITQEQRCLLKLSESTWNRRGAAKLAKLDYNEETVTEVLLLDLHLNFPPGRVIIVPFTKNRESREGADWAWTFVGPDGHSNQGMLVQAKRLDDTDREYDTLYKETKLKGESRPKLQLNRLIESAERYRLPPVYAFYNHLNDISQISHVPKSAPRCIQWCFPRCWGVALASAYKVRRVKPDKSFDRHHSHSLPLHCILCSRWNGKGGPTDSHRAVAAALSQLFEDDAVADELGTDLTPPFKPSDELSPVFRAAQQVHRSWHEGDEGGIAELADEFPGIAGAVILQDGEH